MDAMSFTVASWAERDDLVLEIEVGDEDFGLVSFDTVSCKPMLEIYARASGQEWRMDLEQVREILEKAHLRIREVAGPIEAE